MSTALNTVTFGLGVLVGYWLAYCAVKHYDERETYSVKSAKPRMLTLNEEEAKTVVEILKQAHERQKHKLD